MLKIILFILFSLFILTPIHAAVHTDTHTYIVSPYEHKIVVVDRKTGSETILNFDQYISGIELHEGRGYVTTDTNVLVYNLKTHTHESTISLSAAYDHTFSACLFPMKIHEEYGYVVCAKHNLVFVIDLKSSKLKETIGVGMYPQQIEFDNGFGYVLNNSSRTVSVLSLKNHELLSSLELGNPSSNICFYNGLGYNTRNTHPELSIFDLKSGLLLRTLHIGDNPLSMVIYKELGYIVNKNQITVIDLATQSVTHTISIGKALGPLVFHRNYGYARVYDSDEIVVIDLKALKVNKTISLPRKPLTITIHNDCAYVECHFTCKIYIINLHTHKVIQTLDNPQLMPLDFSDRHLYLGFTNICPLPKVGLVLFDHPYSGIDHPISWEDGDLAFHLFELAVIRHDHDMATTYFNIALACGHKKAYAVAFKAFCHGYWGARQNDDWAKEFSLHVDFDYLRRIKNDPYCFSLISPDQDTSSSSSCSVQ